MRIPISRPFLWVSVAGLTILSGCGPQVNAPSLAPRAVEKQPILLPAEASEAETPLDPALAAQIAPLVAAAQAGDREFARERTSAEAAIAKAGGSAPGDERWIVAQQALSTLDAARGPVRDAVAKIEALRADPAYAGSGNRAAIEAAAMTIESIDGAEATVIAALTRTLGG